MTRSNREMTIPEVRAALAELIECFDVDRKTRARLDNLVEQLCRRPAVTRAPVTSRPTSPLLRAAIRAFHAAHPDATQHAIATVFHVNAGRVSEALAGKRGV